MNIRTRRALGVSVAIAAITASLPVAPTAYADPSSDEVPVADVPDPQGPGCDQFKEAVPTFKSLASQPVGTVLASIPEISTFNSAISGQLNPAVNIVGVLNNGPYVVFAPDNDAFAQLPPGQLETLRADPAALTDLVYYHAFLSLLGPDDVNGQWPTQQGTQIKVTGKGGDIEVNEKAKVVCGGIQAANARIYIIDQVLNMADAPEPITPATLAPSPEAGTTATDDQAAEATDAADEAAPGTEATDATEAPDAGETPAEDAEVEQTPAG